MVPALLLVGLSSNSEVLSPYFNLIWSMDMLGRLSYTRVHWHSWLCICCWCGAGRKFQLHWHFLCGLSKLWIFLCLALDEKWLRWKNGCATAVVIRKVSPFHPVLSTGTKFFCNKLNEDIIIPKRVLEDPNLCLLILPVDGSFLWRKRATFWDPCYGCSSAVSSYPHFVLSVSFLRSAFNQPVSQC